MERNDIERRFGKRLTTVVAALAFAYSLGIMAIPAMADDISTCDYNDKYLYLNISVGSTYGTPWYAKETYSSTYVDIESMGTVDWCFLYADGSNDKSSYVNCTDNDQAYLSHEGQYELHNTVTEQGFTYVRVTAYRTSQGGILTGYWSPDCLGSYADLN